MKHPFSKLALFVAVALALSAAPRSTAQQAAKPQPALSNTTISERSVQVVWEPGGTPPDIRGVLGRLFDDPSMTETAARLLNIKDPALARKVIDRYGALEVTDRGCKFSFRVSVSGVAGARPAAREMAEALVERLVSLLQNDRQEMAAVQANRVRHELQELEAKLESTKQEWRQKQDKLLALGGRADLSAATLQSSLGKLEDERQRVELDLAGMEARLDAVQEQLKAASEKAKEQVAADPVIGEMEKLVAAREKLLKLTQLRVEEGLASPAESARAESDVIEARVQLLDRREAASSRGGDALAPLAREMQTLGIEIRDRKARLTLVSKKLQPMRDISGEFQDLEWMQVESAALRRAWENARERHREAQHRVDDAPVDRVILLNSRDAGGPADGAGQAPEAH